MDCNMFQISNAILNWLDRHGRKRVMPDGASDDEAVIIRYFLFLKDKIRNLNTTDTERNTPFNVFLHKICVDDPRDFHDHPWWYFTIILKGGYWEESPDVLHAIGNRWVWLRADVKKKWRGPGSFRLARATDYHKLSLKAGKPAWTLFIRGRKSREWGFLQASMQPWSTGRVQDGRWVHYKDYLLEGKRVGL